MLTFFYNQITNTYSCGALEWRCVGKLPIVKILVHVVYDTAIWLN